MIAAKKEKDGFPDTTFSFFGIGQPRPQEVKVEGPITTIVVSVGQPDGVLSGTVEDESGRPVPGAQYRLYSKENPEVLIISGADRYGRIETLVPGVPVVVQLEPEGFDQWRSEPILIRVGQVRQLRTKLHHSPK